MHVDPFVLGPPPLSLSALVLHPFPSTPATTTTSTTPPRSVVPFFYRWAGEVMAAAQVAATNVSACLKTAVFWKAYVKDALAGTLQYAPLSELEDLAKEGASLKVGWASKRACAAPPPPSQCRAARPETGSHDVLGWRVRTPG
jgi:hypothetical protein